MAKVNNCELVEEKQFASCMATFLIALLTFKIFDLAYSKYCVNFIMLYHNSSHTILADQ